MRRPGVVSARVPEPTGHYRGAMTGPRTHRGTRLWAAAIPLLGLIAACVPHVVLSRPGSWGEQLRTEPDVLWFGVGMLVLNLAPSIVLAFVLYRSRPRGWFWWTALVLAIVITAGQILVSIVVLIDDDPQAPVLLYLYAPVQAAAVAVVMVVAGVVAALRGRSRHDRQPAFDHSR